MSDSDVGVSSLSMLNPKLVTRRESNILFMNDASSSRTPASKRWNVATNQCAELRRARHNSTASNPALSSVNRERASCSYTRKSSSTTPRRTRDASLGASASFERRKEDNLASNYAHIRSVVKDLIDNRITPLEARHGHAVLQQQRIDKGMDTVDNDMPFYSLRSGSAEERPRSSTRIPRRSFGGITPRVSSPRTTYRTPISVSSYLKEAVAQSPRPSGKHEREGTAAARAVARRSGSREQNLQRSLPRADSEHVERVVANLLSARVPMNHTPRCAKEVPERYKYKAPEPKLITSPTQPNSARFRNIKSTNDIYRRRMSDGSALSLNNNHNRGAGTTHSGMPRHEVKNHSPFPLDITRRECTRMSKNTRASTVKSVERRKVDIPKRVDGYERMLLFGMTPPALSA